MAEDEIATRLSSVRVLVTAKALNHSLVTLCSACHNVIKRVNEDMKSNKDMRTKVNNYLKLDTEYSGETQVLHYLEMLRDVVGFEQLKKKVKYPLTGKIASFLRMPLLRPARSCSLTTLKTLK